jgi:hypothetical protein
MKGSSVSMFFFTIAVVLSQDNSPLAVSRISLRNSTVKMLLVKTVPPGFLRVGWLYALHLFLDLLQFDSQVSWFPSQAGHLAPIWHVFPLFLKI